jgi:hypothetical protein
VGENPLKKDFKRPGGKCWAPKTIKNLPEIYAIR